MRQRRGCLRLEKETPALLEDVTEEEMSAVCAAVTAVKEEMSAVSKAETDVKREMKDLIKDVTDVRREGERPHVAVYCGQLEFMDWEGEEPITVRWTLSRPQAPSTRSAMCSPSRCRSTSRTASSS